MLCDVADRAALEAILDAGGVARPESVSLVRAQRDGLPGEADLRPRDDRRRERSCRAGSTAIEAAGLGDVDVVIRMTGCPNSCARPPTAEIGIFGYGKNDHVMLVGRLARGHAPRARALRAAAGRADGAGAGGSAAGDPHAQPRGAAGGGVAASHASRAAARVGRRRRQLASTSLGCASLRAGCARLRGELS